MFFIENSSFYFCNILKYGNILYYSLKNAQEMPKQNKKTKKMKRNELCPCGSGLKYKNCCGKMYE